MRYRYIEPRKGNRVRGKVTEPKRQGRQGENEANIMLIYI